MRTAVGSFSGPLRLEEVEGEDLWVLTESFTYFAKDGSDYTVPDGFVTDFASVPRALWAAYSPIDHGYRKPAVLHDYLYAYAELFTGDDHGHISRGQADAIFREAMEASGFRKSGRLAIWLAVRGGGWLSWRRYRKQAKERTR